MSDAPASPRSSATPEAEKSSFDFKDPTKLSKFVLWGLYAEIAVAIVAIISNFMEYQFLVDVRDGVYANAQALVETDAAASDFRQLVVGVGGGAIILVSSILILIWIYRANANARALGALNMQFKPGWAIGWYFIPIANLWKPYQALKEIWQTSQGIAERSAELRPSIFPWWWTLWLIYSFLGQAAFRTSMRADDLDSYVTANLLAQGAEVATIPLCLVFVRIVKSVHAGQMDLFTGRDAEQVFA